MNIEPWIGDLDQRMVSLIIKAHPTGSKYICNPAVNDTDEDWVVLHHERIVGPTRNWDGDLVQDAIYFNPTSGVGGRRLIDDDWYVAGSADEQGKTISFKKIIGKVNYNLICTCDPNHYDLWVKATEEAKRLNLVNKFDRVMLFEEMFDKAWFEERKSLRADKVRDRLRDAERYAKKRLSAKKFGVINAIREIGIVEDVREVVWPNPRFDDPA